LSWLEKRTASRPESISYVFYMLGIEKTKKSKGSAFRRAKRQGRKWTVADICKMADYYKEPPAEILTLIDAHYLRNKQFFDNPDNFMKLEE